MLIILIRAIILYIVIIFFHRLMGKRQLGELQPAELVVTILISNIASMPVEDPDRPIIIGLIPIMIFVTFELLISNCSLRSKKLRKIISGRPAIIICNGIIDQKLLRLLRFSVDDLMESLRQNNVFDINEVEYAVIETTGKMSVYKKFNAQEATAKMLNLPGKSEMPPFIVISDGVIDTNVLTPANISKNYIDKVLKDENVALKDVFILSIDSNKKYNLILKEK